MRTKLLLLVILFIPFALHSQARLTPELQEHLAGVKSFEETRDKILAFYTAKKRAVVPGDTSSIRYINRQLKFWNRWFYDNERHLQPDGTVANWSKRMLEIEKEFPTIDASRAANSSWSLIGPTNVDEEDGIGRVLRLGFHPTNASIIYAGTANGGMWRSTNGGSSWANISSFLPTLGVSGIEISEADPNDIYVLSGEGDAWLSMGYTFDYGFVSYSNGVFKSTDGGTTWKETGHLFPGSDTTRFVGFQLRQDPNNANAYLAATSIGISRTTNGGSSWVPAVFESEGGSPISPLTNSIVCFDVEYKPGSSTTVYAGCRIINNFNNLTRYAFFRSLDNGVTFNERDLGCCIWEPALIRFEIGVSPAVPNNVYLLCSPGYIEDGDGSDDSFNGFLRSTNNGGSFAKLAEEPDVFAYNPTVGPTLGNQCQYDMALAISPTNANYIFTGGLVVFRSTDGGFDFDGNTNYWTWEIGETIHPDIHDLKYNPLDGKLYAASDGGVFVTANNGGAWDPLFNGLSISQFYHSEPDNENNKLWGGTQDNGFLEQVSGSTFHEFDAGDGFDVMTDNIVGNGNDSYWTGNGGMVTTQNAGNADITPPNPDMDRRDFGYMDMHPANEDYIYVGYPDAVWYSRDRGDSWEISNVYNRIDGGTVAGHWCIQTCPSNTARLYAAGPSGMWRVDGINFNEAATGDPTNLIAELCAGGYPCNSNGTSIRRMTDIVVHPTTSARVWVTAAGFYEGAKVFYSDDAGLTWDNISYNLPNVPANCLLRDSDGTLYVGMDGGIFYLPSGENGWIPFYNNLPRVPVSEMHFVTEYIAPNYIEFIYASTFGRGIWKSQSFTTCAPTLNVAGTLRGQRFYQVGTSLTSTAILDGVAGTNVRFQSGNEITLNIGFEGKEGSFFHGFLLPCNTGPYPGVGPNTPPLSRSEEKYYYPVVIESVSEDNGIMTILMHVREAGIYGIHLTDEESNWKQELTTPTEYSPGKYTFQISNSSLPGGFHHVSVFNQDGYIHSQEYENR